ncbi:4fe-4s ferredoxin : 4Fe-4S ferredoxin, iron-sulfur binding domain protein OS=Solibacter usitatus (strain Ellin6076) GN=Acid_7587 PE=4 SV=1: Caa3_CtaG [Gemmataceae bacterium]|nr:4fe-4s ferredoxin : 4Fe-4S ferredoxin, iron-sulfur binding domain protein OS=Solibacter usitatus (strain Ellin6076) GN=Acid_7587 PE=4 SV=1: Caa3_CtaG [Gemmataceae bacterium]VTT97044.1 4fe-4s ferredoxin : 4Fe-4S ferredoxin, iron-sulfur binding domain protein OS=Solibacter usitatus (strain Ellin6076) GN=Acid_7587 PE=4 SV=1: Caa3_CtaG [Gemmataceae bacterium]
MTPILDAALRSWPVDPWLVAGLAVTALVYVRGWRVYHRRDPVRWHFGRLAAFLGGLFAIFLALASPLEPFASLLLSVHMAQHLLLVMVAPPLVWLGAPLLPMVRGLPEPVRTYWVGPLFGIGWLRRFVAWLAHPLRAFVVFTATTWAWHLPALYDLALRVPAWHYLQHVCFLLSGLLFWFPVVRPYPVRVKWPEWLLFPYLILADVSNTALSALLCFSDQVIYTHYTAVPRIGGTTALGDQSAAGALMWVPGSVAYLVPLAAIGLRLLFGENQTWDRGRLARLPNRSAGETPAVPARAGGRVPLPMLAPKHPKPRFDLLRVPVAGRFLRWKRSRAILQLPLLVLAGAVVIDGFTGPELAPLNLAGVLPWVHWRGLLVLGLLVAGNVFCTACPFMLPRTIARRVFPPTMEWPRRLRTKWLAVGLLVTFFVAYEAFALWDSPRLTAWIVVGYFVAALAVDGVFRGASFCKYVCPIGQFNFVQSLASPLEVAVRDPAVCKSCTTKDCIRGRGDVPGCELDLAQPRKRGNMDCTFCLDCAHACPHDNIGVLAVPRAGDLVNDPFRSGIGRFSRRPDVAALVFVLLFAAFANAAGMVGPVLEWEAGVQRDLGVEPAVLVVALGAFALVVAPVVLVGSAAWLARALGGLRFGAVEVATRFAFAFVPLGFAMWLAHYGYHLVTTYRAAWPVAQRFLFDQGWTAVGLPVWAACCCEAPPAWLPKLELVVLDCGLLGTLYLAYHQARNLVPTRQWLGAFAPWAALAVALFACGVWLVLQPMQMRGGQ